MKAWFCSGHRYNICQYWQKRNDATAVHGWCKKYKRYVMHTSICGCPPLKRSTGGEDGTK